MEEKIWLNIKKIQLNNINMIFNSNEVTNSAPNNI